MKEYTIEKECLDRNDGNIVLGDCFVDIETEDSFNGVSLVAITKKGWMSKKKVVVEKADVIGTIVDNGKEYCKINPYQIEPLIELFDSKKCKVFTRSRPMDAATAFGLAGMKYGWIYDRIDENG